jgi:hypothetical protein
MVVNYPSMSSYFAFARKLCFHIQQQAHLLAAQHQRYLAMIKLNSLSLFGAQSPFQASAAMPAVAGMILMSVEHGDRPFPHPPQGFVPLQAPIHLLQRAAQSFIL